MQKLNIRNDTLYPLKQSEVKQSQRHRKPFKKTTTTKQSQHNAKSRKTCENNDNRNTFEKTARTKQSQHHAKPIPKMENKAFDTPNKRKTKQWETDRSHHN